MLAINKILRGYFHTNVEDFQKRFQTNVEEVSNRQQTADIFAGGCLSPRNRGSRKNWLFTTLDRPDHYRHCGRRTGC